jgi:phosphoglycerate dehydrogenase-like enzyme
MLHLLLDIGYHCARAAKFFGMTVLAVRRRPELSEGDAMIDQCFGSEEVQTVMSEADYLVVATPLTKATVGLIGKKELAVAKEGQVLINISRGAVMDEAALVAALQSGERLRGAALDVFCVEPLPSSSPMWDLPNLLLSPHNADMTVSFRNQSVKHFTLNCHRFVGGEDLESVVDKGCGY